MIQLCKVKNMEKSIKIILVGSRYTGKGQIGRAWGKTKADLPTLQPVLLYDRKIEIKKFPDKLTRVVAWVLSFDSEFENLRSSFYRNPEPDGLLLTFDLTNSAGNTLDDMQNFRNEIKKKNGYLPPQVLMGIQLSNRQEISDDVRYKAKKWAEKTGNVPYFEAIYYNDENFANNVDNAFLTLISIITSTL